MADLGGLVGINAYPAFVKQGGKGATVADLVDHIDYLVDLIGPDQVGLGLDFCELSPEIHAEMIASGEWSIEDYPDDSGTYPIGLETPAQIPNITKRTRQQAGLSLRRHSGDSRPELDRSVQKGVGDSDGTVRGREPVR